MVCDQCKELGLKSTINILGSSSTCMAGGSYYDEDGKFHYEDPNISFTECRCSNGHEFTVQSSSSNREKFVDSEFLIKRQEPELQNSGGLPGADWFKTHDDLSFFG